MIAAPDSTGRARSPRIAVMNSDHTERGRRNHVIPGARLWMRVVTQFKQPRMDDNPTRMIETDQSSCQADAPEKSCRADTGAEIDQPARADPAGPNRPGTR